MANPDTRADRYKMLPCKVIAGMNRGDYEILRAELAAEYCGICPYCGIPFPIRPGDQWDCALVTVDHIEPRDAGGTDDRENLAPACYSCNSRKGRRTLLAFLALPPLRRRHRRPRPSAKPMPGTRADRELKEAAD